MSIEGYLFSPLDKAFAEFLSKRASLKGAQKLAFEQLLMELSFQQNRGHNCIAVSALQIQLLEASGLASQALRQTRLLPLVIEENRLYLQRYWFYETRLAKQIKALTLRHHSPENLEPLLERYFGKPLDDTDWQREAANKAAQLHYCMITGGPGTGKTTTVIKILAILQELAVRPLHIVLAAPTGKAASRLKEAIGFNKADLPCSTEIKNLLPDEVYTLHRLLGAKAHSSNFFHSAEQPLVYDVVVVDEASMVDLALMSKLLDALKVNARLVLLGDKDQLASVESGAVLADLSNALPKYTVELKKSHRFNEAIKGLAVAINSQQHELAWQLISAGESVCQLLNENLIGYIAEQRRVYLQLVKGHADFQSCYQAFNQFGVLCANRQGTNSVADINQRLEQHLAAEQLINPAQTWYPGRPVMITQNQPDLKLYNGDIGLCLYSNGQDGQLMVFFQRADGTVKSYLPTRLPAVETVFAMTIHKSQGSEFDKVLVVLPESVSPLLTKELLYTAITRAKQSLRLATSKAVFAATIRQKIERVTGLEEKLSGGA